MTKDVVPPHTMDSSDPFVFFRNRGKKIVNFAIVNHCNAKCVYCSFHKEKVQKYVGLDDAKRAIDYFCDIDIGVLSLTGGEPLLNPYLPDIIRYARGRGLIVYTGTNALALTEEFAKELKMAGVSAVWISFESSSFDAFDMNRGIPALHEKVISGLHALNDVGLNVFAIALINKSIGDLSEFAKMLLSMGFDKVKFDYPMCFPLGSTYKGWETTPLLKFSPGEMGQFINSILSLKKSGLIKVINPTIGLLGAARHYNKIKPLYPCCAGEKVLYADWNLDIYRCPVANTKMGCVGERIKFEKITCDACYYQWVRDYDAFFYLLDLVGDFLEKPGSLLTRARTKKTAQTFTKIYESIMAAWEIKNSGVV